MTQAWWLMAVSTELVRFKQESHYVARAIELKTLIQNKNQAKISLPKVNNNNS